MQITTERPFDRSARLWPRRRQGLPARRRPGGRVLAVGAAIAVFLGGGLALNSAEPATVVGATAGAVALVIALTFTVGLVSASSGRARYRALR